MRRWLRAALREIRDVYRIVNDILIEIESGPERHLW